MSALHDGLRAYAVMLNTLQADVFEPWLAEDFSFESQWVLSSLDSKAAYLAYQRPKLETIRRSGATVYAELGDVDAYGKRQPCVIVAQPRLENLVCLALGEARDGKLVRLDLCIVPRPGTVARSGVYPVSMTM